MPRPITQAESQRATNAETTAKAEAQRADLEAEKARQQAARAENEAAIAKALNEFLQQDLLGMAGAASQISAELSPDPNIKLRTVVDLAATSIQQRFGDRPVVEAAIRRTLGNTYLSLGEYKKAEHHYRRALRRQTQALGPEHPETLGSLESLAFAIGKRNRRAEAEQLYRQALAIRFRKFGLENLDTLKCMRS